MDESGAPDSVTAHFDVRFVVCARCAVLVHSPLTPGSVEQDLKPILFVVTPSLRNLAGLSSLSVAAIAHGSFSKDLTNRLEPAKEFCVFLTLRRLLFHCLHPHFEPVFRCSRRGMRDADFGWFVAEAFAKQLYGSRIGGNTLLGLLLSSCISQCGSFVRQDTRLPNSKSWLHVYMIRKVSSCWEEGLKG